LDAIIAGMANKGAPTMRTHQLQDTALRYFLEVVRSGSLTVASARLHVAASALSRQIAGLEQGLGVALFERQPRGMVPTAAGEILAAHARRTSLDAERVVEDLAALQGLRLGRVRVAATEGLASQFLPPLIMAFRPQHPHLVFDVQVVVPAEVPQRLRAGDADIGLTFSRTPEKDIQVEYRQPAPICVLMRPDHPLAEGRPVALASLCAHPLALPSAETTVRQLIDLACSRQQLLLAPVLTSNALAVLLEFVTQGGGLSVAGEVSVRHLVAAGRVVARPIDEAAMAWREVELQTLAGRVLPQAVLGFLDHLRQHLPARL
jgi:DNA-binding transcriptional LysR family regulator